VAKWEEAISLAAMAAILTEDEGGSSSSGSSSSGSSSGSNAHGGSGGGSNNGNIKEKGKKQKPKTKKNRAKTCVDRKIEPLPQITQVSPTNAEFMSTHMNFDAYALSVFGVETCLQSLPTSTARLASDVEDDGEEDYDEDDDDEDNNDEESGELVHRLKASSNEAEDRNEVGGLRRVNSFNYEEEDEGDGEGGGALAASSTAEPSVDTEEALVSPVESDLLQEVPTPYSHPAYYHLAPHLMCFAYQPPTAT
jgi:hypothetical protein